MNTDCQFGFRPVTVMSQNGESHTQLVVIIGYKGHVPFYTLTTIKGPFKQYLTATTFNRAKLMFFKHFIEELKLFKVICERDINDFNITYGFSGILNLDICAVIIFKLFMHKNYAKHELDLFS